MDIGGWDFYLTAKEKEVPFDSWTTLEISKERFLDAKDEKLTWVYADGRRLPFKSGSFSTILNIQVLEHVFEPIQMVFEISRVLKKGGYGIFLIPQTGSLHAAPDHFYNFTRFWIKQVMEESGLSIVELRALGGFWSSAASRMLYFFLQGIRSNGFSDREIRRNLFFYLLFPLMALVALISIPICLMLSLGDLKEEPNNHLVVVKKI